jgi:hypothetical protein
VNDLALWNRMREAWLALGPQNEPVVQRFVNASGLDERAWGLLLAAITFEPENTTPAHLLVRGPYSAVDYYLSRLKAITASGYMAALGEGQFCLTSLGRSETLRFIDEIRKAMVAVDPLTRAEGEQLARLVERLVQSCLQTPPPPETWSIRHSYVLMPEPEPALPFIEQAFSCLAAYRDDSHLAAWQESGLSATALEALTVLWRNRVDSMKGLLEALAHRGHPAEVYEDALDELRKRKFIAGTKRSLLVTTKGRQFRDQVETDTDRFFFAPWSVLNPAEKNRLDTLLVRLRDGLRL